MHHVMISLPDADDCKRLLIVAMPVPYMLQFARLYALRSADGLSLWAASLSTLVSQIQVAYMSYLFKMSPIMKEGTSVATPPSTRDRLNFTQLIIQWLCSLAL